MKKYIFGCLSFGTAFGMGQMAAGGSTYHWIIYAVCASAICAALEAIAETP